MSKMDTGFDEFFEDFGRHVGVVSVARTGIDIDSNRMPLSRGRPIRATGLGFVVENPAMAALAGAGKRAPWRPMAGMQWGNLDRASSNVLVVQI